MSSLPIISTTGLRESMAALDRMSAEARAGMSEQRWAELQAEWNS